MVKLLLKKGADSDLKDTRFGRTPLSWAAISSYKAVAKLLLEKSIDPDSKNNYGQTPLLLLAAINGYVQLLRTPVFQVSGEHLSNHQPHLTDWWVIYSSQLGELAQCWVNFNP